MSPYRGIPQEYEPFVTKPKKSVSQQLQDQVKLIAQEKRERKAAARIKALQNRGAQ